MVRLSETIRKSRYDRQRQLEYNTYIPSISTKQKFSYQFSAINNRFNEYETRLDSITQQLPNMASDARHSCIGGSL